MPPRVQLKRSFMRVLPFTQNNKKINATWYRIELTNGGLNLQGAEAIATKESQRLLALGKKGDIDVSYMLQDGQWRNSKKAQVGQAITLYHPDEYGPKDVFDGPLKIEQMTVTIRPPVRAGKDDNNNDCLYNSIMLCLGDYKKKFNITAEDFKTKLGVKREEKVPLTSLGQVEEIFKIRINCYGEYHFRSKIRDNNVHRHVINIEVNDEHVTPYQFNEESEKRKRKQLLSNYHFKERDIIVKQNRQGLVEFYDGINKPQYLSGQEFFSQILESHKYTVLDVNCDDIVKEYNDIIKSCKTLKRATLGRINLKKGRTISSHILKKLCYNSYGVAVPDSITPHETEFIRNIQGGVMMAKEGIYEGELFEYDFNSFYANLMLNMNFPMKVGVDSTVKLSEVLKEEFVRYGIYNVKIDTSKTFYLRQDVDNMYTHYDVMLAKELNLKIESIDGSDNVKACLYPPEARELGQRIFQRTIDEFYALKLQKLPLIKFMLNSLWGALCEKAVQSIFFNVNDGFELPSGASIESIQPVNIETEEFRVKYAKNGKLFKTDYARIGKFLTANGRVKLYHLLKGRENSIIRIHTDGFISTKRFPDLDKQNKNKSHGKVKHSVLEPIKITNVNDITFLKCGHRINDKQCLREMCYKST